MKIIFYTIFIFTMAMASFFTFGISGMFSIVFGHALLVYKKKELSNRMLMKYLTVLSLVISYGYLFSILFLAIFWMFSDASF